MNNVATKKSKDTTVRNIENYYGVVLKYASDAEMHTSLKERGLPTLSRLIKKTRFAK